MTKQQKVNQLARKIGIALATTGIKMIRSAFHINSVKISYNEMQTFLQDITENKLNYISLADQNYYLIPWEQWKQIIEVDWTDKKKYLKDKFDCDDFAFMFASIISWIFKLNTAGIVHGKVNIGHFWNAIVAEKNGRLRLFYYDAKRGTYMEYQKGQPIIMKGWNYTCYSMRFF